MIIVQRIQNGALVQSEIRPPDQFVREIANARISRGLQRQDLRIIARKMLADFRNLSADQVRVVDDPFGGGRQHVIELRGLQQVGADGIQDVLIML